MNTQHPPPSPARAPGRVSGTVRDNAGTVISGAGIDLTNTTTGVSVSTTTDALGRYDLRDLLPGSYELRIQRAGFKSEARSGIVVSAGSSASINVELPPAVVVATVLEPQELLPNNCTPNLLEGLEARIKDPLWFLARQWQTGEFEAENGGGLAQVEIGVRSIAIDLMRSDSDHEGKRFPVEQPLNSVVEAETGSESPAWESSRLEYRFTLGEPSGFSLQASEYDGFALDWYHFDLEAEGKPSFGTEATVRMVPQTLRPAGVPHSRWWRFEDGEIDVTQLASAEPNFLQMLLAEYLMIDSDNWYVLPVVLQPGHLSHLSKIRVVDSFGVAAEVTPTLERWGGNEWSIFTHSTDAQNTGLNGSHIYLPNIVPGLAQSEPLEVIRIIRDESANVAFAVEEYYTDKLGHRVNRGDVETAVGSEPDGLDPAAQNDPSRAGLPVYRLMHSPPRHWIPYLPRRAPSQSPGGSLMYLRRARTDANSSHEKPQYLTQIITESWRLEEEEVPRIGLRVQRLRKTARDFRGKDYFWVGRRKDVGAAEHSAGVDFDYLLEVKPPEGTKKTTPSPKK